MTVVQFAHVPLFVIQLGFLLFQMLGFARGQFATLDPVGDAILLIFLALVDGGRRGCRRAVLRRYRQHQTRHYGGQNKTLILHCHGVSPLPLFDC